MTAVWTNTGSKTRRRRAAMKLRHNAYVTDGRRLFRCVLAEDGPMLMLEDCQTLELILCSLAELAESEMRIVKNPGAPRPAALSTG